MILIFTYHDLDLWSRSKIKWSFTSLLTTYQWYSLGYSTSNALMTYPAEIVECVARTPSHHTSFHWFTDEARANPSTCSFLSFKAFLDRLVLRKHCLIYPNRRWFPPVEVDWYDGKYVKEPLISCLHIQPEWGLLPIRNWLRFGNQRGGGLCPANFYHLWRGRACALTMWTNLAGRHRDMIFIWKIKELQNWSSVEPNETVINYTIWLSA